MTDYYYIKPGCKIKGGTVGQDYFISVKDAQTYARSIYKWGVVSNEKLMATIEEYAKYSGEVVPPQAEGQEIKANEPWSDAWKKMRDSGWRWKEGSGLMMDYFYIKPGCKIKGSVEGQDYFTSLEDVQKFASRNYGWVGDEEDISEENEVCSYMSYMIVMSPSYICVAVLYDCCVFISHVLCTFAVVTNNVSITLYEQMTEAKSTKKVSHSV